MEGILERLRCNTTRGSMAANYYAIWKKFNKFLLQLDECPDSWEHRVTLYGAYLVNRGVQSSTIHSYFSAIKKILTYDQIKYNHDEVMLHILSRSCRLLNDRILTRLPIHLSLLELLLFELSRQFKSQYYLEVMCKAIFSLAYYELFRI